MNLVLCQFHALLPQYSKNQEQALDWLSAAHTRAQLMDEPLLSSDERELLPLRMKKRVHRFGCPPLKINTRYSQFEDFTHAEWERMKLFPVEAGPSGIQAKQRSLLFSENVKETFKKFYSETFHPPDGIIHVSCTGYVAPSAAQHLVAQKDWGTTTEVIHAYHMGCYASIPAVKIGASLLQSRPAATQMDIVHTELCTLHLNPSLHSPEQLVVQSLFSDGMIKYSLLSPGQFKKSDFASVGLKVIALKEEIVPDSEGEMTWIASSHGMEMTLSRKVPEVILSVLTQYLARLSERAELSLEELRKNALFAIHPGGPKIIDGVQAYLGLTDEQVQASAKVLCQFGNMSSATLPHIWKLILEDPQISAGKLVVSLAFGPGLTIAGGIFQKVLKE